MLDRCPNAQLIGPAWLDGYAFRWRGLADIELDPDAYVIGVLWKIDDDDLDTLDHFEGVPKLYMRQRVIISTSSENHTGWAYMMARQGTEYEPNVTYRDAVFDGYEENGLSDEQLLSALQRVGS